MRIIMCVPLFSCKGKNRMDRGIFYDAINLFVQGHAEFGEPADCANAAALDTTVCSRGSDACGGIDVGYTSASAAVANPGLR